MLRELHTHENNTCVGGAGVITDSCPAHTLPTHSSSLAKAFLLPSSAPGSPSPTQRMPRVPSSRRLWLSSFGKAPALTPNSHATRASTQAESAVKAMATVCALLRDKQRSGSTRASCSGARGYARVVGAGQFICAAMCAELRA